MFPTAAAAMAAFNTAPPLSTQDCGDDNAGRGVSKMMPKTFAGFLVLSGLLLSGCATPDKAPLPQSMETGQYERIECARYARIHSDVKIYGDANAWWDLAGGRYARTDKPSIGSVIVLHDYASSTHGHVAIVKKTVNSRELRVDHANWLNDGAIYLNNPVLDISKNNDWSVVKFWNIRAGAWGRNVYPVKGFIGPGKE